jgi:PKD repeat protein
MINKYLFLTALTFLGYFNAAAQTNLFTESFEGVSGFAFTLNTADQSSVSGTSGSNYWQVNNAYTGGSGSLICLGFPFAFTISNTPTQPAGIIGSPNSKYMHISSAAAIASGINNASFTAADGICNFNENYFSKMSADVSTIGFDSVEISFYWLCAGGPQSYGELFSSIDGGTTWQQVSSPAQFNNQSNWTQQKISLPLFAQKSTLRFGFRFVNLQTSTAADPSFSIDDVSITGFVAGPVNTIAAPTFNGNAFCPGDALTINFTASGSYGAGNVFTAQLSNASGSFATPTVIGQLSSQTAGPINAVIPPGTVAGNGYRIRVISGNPNTVGADNGTDISIAAGPIAGTASSGLDSICSGSGTTVTLSGVFGSAIWETSSNGSAFNASTYIGNSFNTGILSQSVYLRAIVQNSCGADTSNIIYILVLPTPSAAFTYTPGAFQNLTFDNNTVGNFTNASWNFGDGNSSTSTAASITHSYSSIGTYAVSLTVTNEFGCSSTYTDSIEIFPVSVSLFENENFEFSVYPNPSTGNFNIDFSIDHAQEIEISVIDINGRRIVQLLNAMLPEGKQSISNNVELASGVYFVEIKAARGRQISKLILH